MTKIAVLVKEQWVKQVEFLVDSVSNQSDLALDAVVDLNAAI